MKKALTSHELAKILLQLPDYYVGSNETGELAVSANINKIALGTNSQFDIMVGKNNQKEIDSNIMNIVEIFYE